MEGGVTFSLETGAGVSAGGGADVTLRAQWSRERAGRWQERTKPAEWEWGKGGKRFIRGTTRRGMDGPEDAEDAPAEPPCLRVAMDAISWSTLSRDTPAVWRQNGACVDK